jgi:WD40 repeat protein
MPTRYWMVSARTLLLAMVTGSGIPLAFSADSPPSQEKVRVTCPAVELDESQRPINGPPEMNSGPIELVVLGRVNHPEKDGSRRPDYELRVEKVLYGSTPNTTLRFQEHFFIPGADRQIFALVPQAYGGSADYELRYHVDVKEENSQRALSAARLDYHTLAADAILVGRETAVSANGFEHTVEVVRLLHGSEPEAGDSRVMETSDAIQIADKVPTTHPEPMLYFIRIEHDFRHRKVYRIDTRLPVACEADVVAALKRRDLYPIVETGERGKKLRGREVVFRGSVDEAIDFLGSERMGAVNLAVRAITRQKDAACERLAAAIQREMFRQAEPAWGEFRKLHNLIRLLGRLGGGSPGGLLARLLEKDLDYLESKPAEPPAPRRTWGARYRNEVNDDNVNHAPAWLAVAIDEQVLPQQCGNRLIKLRDAAKGHWKSEVQLALDAAHVEDNRELIALAKEKPAGALHSRPRIYHPRGVGSVAFSHDGKFLATGGAWDDIRIWNTADWTLAAMIEQDGHICQLGFSPDGKVLSAIQVDGRDMAEQCFAWRTGIRVAQQGPAKTITDPRYHRAWSLPTPDGKYRVTASTQYSDGQFIRLQVLPTNGTRQFAAEVRFPSVWDDTLVLAIAPNSGQAAIASGDVRLAFYSLPDLERIRELYFPFRARRSERFSELRYSPDGKVLAAAQDGCPTPRFFCAETGEETMPYEGHASYPVDLRFLPDGKALRSIGVEGTVCLWDAATLKMLRRTSLPSDRLPASVRPSDGRYVLCPLAGDAKTPIQVVDVDTGKALCEVVLPITWSDVGVTEGGVAGVRRVYWLNDQEVLCTGYFIDRSGASDHWWRFNYRTGQILRDGRIHIETQNSLLNGRGEVTEDGRHIFVVNGEGKGDWGPLQAEWIDTATLTSRRSGEARIERQPNGDFGLVPGGKYFHIGSHVFDRQTLKLVAVRDFPRDTLGMIVFSPDGSRYAAAIVKTRSLDEWPGVDEWSWHRKYSVVVRVHETLTGKTLLAFSPSAYVRKVAFSADAQRVATANDDGTIEVHQVPLDETKVSGTVSRQRHESNGS